MVVVTVRSPGGPLTLVLVLDELEEPRFQSFWYTGTRVWPRTRMAVPAPTGWAAGASGPAVRGRPTSHSPLPTRKAG